MAAEATAFVGGGLRSLSPSPWPPLETSAASLLRREHSTIHQERQGGTEESRVRAKEQRESQSGAQS